MHTFKTSTTAVLLNALAVTAQFNDVEIEAHQNPNATRSINFKPFPDYPDWNNTEWKWRVNVTDFAQRENRLDLRTVHVVYDFSWPQAGNITDTFPINNRSFCMTYAVTEYTPANITNKWTEDNADSTDCAPALGQACVDAVLAASTQNGGNSNTSCITPRTIWADIPACAGTFEYIRQRDQYRSFGVSTQNIKNRASGAVVGVLSSGRNKGNATVYDDYLNTLHVVLLNPPPLVVNGSIQGSNGTPKKQLLCMRVSTERKEIPEEEKQDGAGEGNEDGKDGKDGDGKNVAGRNAMVGLWSGLMVALAVGFAL